MGGEGGNSGCGGIIIRCQRRGRSYTGKIQSYAVFCCRGLELGCWCFCFRATGTDPDLDPETGSTVSPSSDPLVDAARFVLDVLRLLFKRSLPCHENVTPNERRHDSGASTAVSMGLEGVKAVRFGIPESCGFDMALVPGWEAVALRSFRCNFFGEQDGEQGVVFAPSFALVLGSEMVAIGRGASAAAPFRCGLVAPGGAVRQDWCLLNRDGVRRNLADFHSCSSIPERQTDSGGYKPSSLKRTCMGATACDSTTSQLKG